MNLSEKDKKRFWSKVDKRGENECWNWIGRLNQNSYGQFDLNKSPKKSHRISLFLEKGEPPIDKQFALHTCKQNPKCCNPNHLYYGNYKDNERDKVKDGTHSKGETQGSSKLTEEQVREIRKKYIPYKYTIKKLSKEYFISQAVICEIINNKYWKHVQ